MFLSLRALLCASNPAVTLECASATVGRGALLEVRREQPKRRQCGRHLFIARVTALIIATLDGALVMLPKPARHVGDPRLRRILDQHATAHILDVLQRRFMLASRVVIV